MKILASSLVMKLAQTNSPKQHMASTTKVGGWSYVSVYAKGSLLKLLRDRTMVKTARMNQPKALSLSVTLLVTGVKIYKLYWLHYTILFFTNWCWIRGNQWLLSHSLNNNKTKVGWNGQEKVHCEHDTPWKHFLFSNQRLTKEVGYVRGRTDLNGSIKMLPCCFYCTMTWDKTPFS